MVRMALSHGLHDSHGSLACRMSQPFCVTVHVKRSKVASHKEKNDGEIPPPMGSNFRTSKTSRLLDSHFISIKNKTL